MIIHIFKKCCCSFYKSEKQQSIYLNAIKLSIPLAVAKISVKIHITMATILKQKLFAQPPAPIVSEPATMMKNPDHIPPPTTRPHQFEAATIMTIPINSVMIPMARIAIPVNKNKLLIDVSYYILIFNFNILLLQNNSLLTNQQLAVQFDIEKKFQFCFGILKDKYNIFNIIINSGF